MKKHLIRAAVLLAVLCCGRAGAQSIGPSTINAAGGTNDLGGNTYEWSVGDMAVITTYASGSLVVTQGTLQPFHIPTGVGSISLDDHIKAYPNPTVNLVYLEYNLLSEGNMDYILQDITGKTILRKTLQVKPGAAKEIVHMEALANATYMLNVSFQPKTGAAQTTSFKIVKSGY